MLLSFTRFSFRTRTIKKVCFRELCFIFSYIFPVVVGLCCQLDWIKGNLEDDMLQGMPVKMFPQRICTWLSRPRGKAHPESVHSCPVCASLPSSVYTPRQGKVSAKARGGSSQDKGQTPLDPVCGFSCWCHCAQTSDSSFLSPWAWTWTSDSRAGSRPLDLSLAVSSLLFWGLQPQRLRSYCYSHLCSLEAVIMDSSVFDCVTQFPNDTVGQFLPLLERREQANKQITTTKIPPKESLCEQTNKQT